MRNSAFPASPAGLLLLSVFVPLVLCAELRVELIELPPDAADVEAADSQAVSVRVSILSERFAGTGLGRHFIRLSPEKPFTPSGEAVLFTDPRLLSRTSPAHTNVVVDLEKQRLYLLVGHRMILESEVSVHQFGQVTPTGFFLMTDRIKNGPIAEGLHTRIPYWMHLGSTEFGMHGGHLYGYASAGGCVRLPLPAAELLFEKTQEGTPVAIFESWSRETYATPRRDTPGNRSSKVAAGPLNLEDSAPPAIDPPDAPEEPSMDAAVAQPSTPVPADAPVLPPPLPSSLRAVTGSPSISESPAPPSTPLAQDAPRQLSGSTPSPVPEPPKTDTSPRQTSSSVTKSEPEPPEVARLRNLFKPSTHPQPERAPLFPSNKQLRLLDLGANRAQKGGATDNPEASSRR